MVRCHYEVLGVERNADQDMLKKAYRKLALKVYFYIFFVFRVVYTHKINPIRVKVQPNIELSFSLN